MAEERRGSRAESTSAREIPAFEFLRSGPIHSLLRYSHNLHRADGMLFDFTSQWVRESHNPRRFLVVDQ